MSLSSEEEAVLRNKFEAIRRESIREYIATVRAELNKLRNEIKQANPGWANYQSQDVYVQHARGLLEGLMAAESILLNML